MRPSTSPDLVHFNHGLGQIVTALIKSRMQLTSLEEHDTAPWNPLDGAMEEVAGNEFRLRDHPERLPLTYTLQAVKVDSHGDQPR